MRHRIAAAPRPVSAADPRVFSGSQPGPCRNHYALPSGSPSGIRPCCRTDVPGVAGPGTPACPFRTTTMHVALWPSCYSAGTGRVYLSHRKQDMQYCLGRADLGHHPVSCHPLDDSSAAEMASPQEASRRLHTRDPPPYSCTSNYLAASSLNKAWESVTTTGSMPPCEGAA